ncbi:MAG: 16S rRNA (cytosine(1402)-N(4))-methyltransferase RsmH [Gammaproteobacteria bacterium]|nr:16S rRNA (cytosine(1402)-N(4))-methyltransferase RsmH [Gammaproteobacteria bacterium]
MTETFTHQPVLLEEAVDALNIKPDGIYIDGTFGRGGHSAAILSKLGESGKLIAFDQDPEAIAVARERFAGDARFEIVHENFSAMGAVVKAKGLSGKVNGVLLDIGVSSPQFDDAERGFSFSQSGPLDMRMNPGQGVSAAEWLSQAEAKDIARVLRVYGEEKFANKIAFAIVDRRQQSPIETTMQLSGLIADVVPKKFQDKHKHPATRSFQAIRIFINKELEVLEQVLAQVNELLCVGGRLSVISFHSLEDRITKRFIKKMTSEPPALHDLPIRNDDIVKPMKKIGKAIKAGKQELEHNPRARSAVLRVAERVS